LSSPFNEAKYRALLEGLEAVEVNLSSCKSIIDFRIDANTYKKDYLKSEILINTLPNRTVEDISTTVQNFGAYSLCNFIDFQDTGIPFLMTQNIRQNFIDWKIEKFVNEKDHEMLYKSHCRKGQVLVTMAGEYLGRVAVYDRNEVCSSNQAIAKVTLKKNLSPYLVSTFLNSKHGQNQINRLKTITGQPNINMSLIKSLKVPLFSESFQIQLEKLIIESETKRNSTSLKYKQAETILLETLGLKNFEPSKEPVNVKGFNESFLTTGRLDAEYYQKKYEDYEKIIKINTFGFTLISNEYILVKNISKKEKESYNYIEIGDVNVNDGSTKYSSLNTCELPANAKTEVKRGDLLISKVRSNRGAVTIIDFDAENLIVSGAFTVLREKKTSVFSNETLKVLLRTNIYKDWLLQFNIGTQYPVIRDEDIFNMPIPKISKEIQEVVTKQIQSAQNLKKQSEQLLETAKRAVEIAIEQDEEAAIRYIEEA
jgi:type I restriction enzyme, S subunit